MSGGFFRGTSAEQDTRFSNKQAKLMKSQKFAPELENLVDMTKVKMDVLRPWIANRVTEFIGFEDEVLINFIYGLLEGKVVNGKEIQISLTGFMERNTGKFMKELWVLLLSAQNNASGVPQQFLDAKEEESKKKKAESDRLTNEIQIRKEKESRELEEERHKKMDAGNGLSKDSVEPSSKDQPTDLVPKTEKQKQHDGKNGFQGRRSSRSPILAADHSSSPRGRRLKSVSRSISNSKSNSKSRSRSVSISPKWRRRPSPSENRFPLRRVSKSPYRRRSPRRSITPARRRSTYYRQRSISPSRHSSPSPPRYRRRTSPVRRRSRSPLRRRSRSPMRRRSRSPMRPRSRSPLRHQSRSPSNGSLSPVRARSPFIRRRSPAAVYRRSPMRYRSPSPPRRRQRGSPSIRQRSPSPLKQSIPRRRSPSPIIHKSSLPRVWSSPSHSRSASPVKRSPPGKYTSPSRERTRDQLKSSKVHDTSPPPRSERASVSLKRDTSLEENDFRRKAKALPLSPHKSLSNSKAEREMSPIEAKRSRGLRESPTLANKGKITRSHIHSPKQEPQNEKSTIGSLKNSNPNSKIDDNIRKDVLSSHKSSTNPSKGHKSSQGMSSFEDESSKKMESYNKDRVFESGNKVEKVDPYKVKDASLTRGTRDSGTYEKTKSHSNDIEIKDQPKEKMVPLGGSSSEESDEKGRKVDEKKKNKRSRELVESENESSFDSYEEERKESKRRRKEEKKSRKEERRKKRHERRRKREEKHAKKKPVKSVDSVSSGSDSDVDTKETESEKKKLEMQLREKALESLRAKKGIGH